MEIFPAKSDLHFRFTPESQKPIIELISLTRPFAEENTARTWFHLVTSLAALGMSLALTLPDFPLAVRILGSVLMSLVFVRLFIIYHDYPHGAIFRNSRIGQVLMYGFGILYLRPPNDWKRSHNFHHQNNTKFATANIGSFPIMTRDEYLNATEQKQRSYRIIRSPLVLVFGYVTIFVLESFKKLFCSEFKGMNLRWQAFQALVVHFALCAFSLHFGWSVFLLSFFLPYFASCAMGSYLFYMQHNFEGALFKPDEEWDFAYAALNSSSCLKCGTIAHWFTGNIGYHHIHHLNHKIPFYNLPRAMKAIPELQKPIFVDLKPRTIWRTLQLKLWDANQRKMITFQELGS